MKKTRYLHMGIIIFACIWAFTGCSTFAGQPLNTGTVSAAENTPQYYGFPDVLIPGEFKEEKKTSYLVQSHGFSAGVLSFRGRVDRGSLIAFFRENMAKDNWQAIGSFTSSKTILLFHKENRWCVINITEGDFYTYIEIGVVPKVMGGAVN